MQKILKIQFGDTDAFSALFDLFLIFAAVFGAIGSLVTAFDLPVNLPQLALILFACALTFTFIITAYGRNWFLLSLLPLVVIAIWQMPVIIGGFRGVLFTVSYSFSNYLYLTVLFPYAEIAARETVAFIIAASILLTVLLTFAVCYYRSLPVLFIITVGAVFPVFVVVFIPANTLFLVLLIGVHILMFFRGSFFGSETCQRPAKHIPAVLGFSVLLLLSAAVLSPYGSWTHNSRVREIGRDIRSVLADIGLPSERVGVGWPQIYNGEWGFNVEHTSVADAGMRHVADVPLLEINTNRPGIFYLKGFTQGYFDGRTWHQNPYAAPLGEITLPDVMPVILLSQLVSSHIVIQGEFAITDIAVRNVGDMTPVYRYLPYFSVSSQIAYPYTTSFIVPYIDFSEILTRSAPLGVAGALAYYEYLIRSEGIYTQVEDSTAEALRQMAADAGIDAAAGRWQVAEQVAAFIMSAAQYSTTAHITPQDEDFTLFFLERSMMGYCIHFATAATLMLRALDIPARFAVGFLVVVPPTGVGEYVTVTDRYAHAWVEVFLQNFGWVHLEVTPAGDGVGFGPGMTGAWAEEFMDPYWWLEYWDADAPVPVGGLGDAHDDEGEISWSLASLLSGNIFQIFLVLAACLIIFILFGFFSKKTRAKKFAQPDTNSAVLSIWQYLARLRKNPQVSQDIEDLVLKARYSLHQITEGERRKMIGYAEYFRDKTYNEQGLPGKLWLHLRIL